MKTCGFDRQAYTQTHFFLLCTATSDTELPANTTISFYHSNGIKIILFDFISWWEVERLQTVISSLREFSRVPVCHKLFISRWNHLLSKPLTQWENEMWTGKFCWPGFKLIISPQKDPWPLKASLPSYYLEAREMKISKLKCRGWTGHASTPSRGLHCLHHVPHQDERV